MAKDDKDETKDEGAPPKAPSPSKKRKAKEGFALLTAPKDVTGCSVDGKEYQADESSVVEVPAEHVPELVDRGFSKAGE